MTRLGANLLEPTSIVAGVNKIVKLNKKNNNLKLLAKSLDKKRERTTEEIEKIIQEIIGLKLT
tara:strand:- start:624 stop:812 length:189 start_codon:yes stop_codon:yes gene_type:complete